MLPPDTDVAAQLRHQIYYMLDNDFPDNALFAASRLHALDPRGADAAHILALCHLRLGKLKAAFDYAREKGARGQHLGCAYVFALACLGLERYHEGLGALERSRSIWSGRSSWNKHSETSRSHLPDAPAVLSLMGKLARGLGDDQRSIEYHSEALKLNPFMWDGFVDMCNTGVNLRTSNIFQLPPELATRMLTSQSEGSHINQAVQKSSSQTHPNLSSHHMFTTPANDPFQSSLKINAGLNLGNSNFMSRLNGMQQHANQSGLPPDTETPITNGGSAHDGDVMMEDAAGHNGNVQISEPPQAPTRKRGTFKAPSHEGLGDPPRMTTAVTRSRSRQGSEQAESESSRSSVPSNHNYKRTISGHVSQASASNTNDPTAAPQRKSVRLLNQIRPSTTRQGNGQAQDTEPKDKRELRKVRATGAKGRSGPSTVGRVVSGNRKAMDMHERQLKETRTASLASGISMPAPMVKAQNPPRPQPSREQEAVEWLLDLFGKLGSGFYLLSRFQCEAALEQFLLVPAPQRDSPWVQAQIGKAFYQSGEYVQAKEAFERVKRLAPSRMEDNEVYSTVLWHLKAETDLAYLSHELVEADRLSPQAWCAVGNSFSLQRDHDQAIKCFRRATQLDPRFAYAHTLQGHEHLENEEFDKALLAYRNAVATDQRHYYGWYGLGKVYEKMEKYDVSEKHYQCAAAINPTSAALAAHVGVVLEKQRKPRAALVQYTKACELDPRSALSRFKKARILMILKRPQDALVELETLKDIAPDEANVHFMLGRLYKSQSDRTAAIRHFTIALNLDPKAAQYIKEQMESLDSAEDDEYEDDDT